MHSIRIDQQTVLVIDSKGALSNRQEEAVTYKASGKSSEAVGMIMGCSTDTVNKHLGKAYVKLDVNKNDNPFALLLTLSVKKGWMQFISLTLACIFFLPLSMPARNRTSTQRTVRPAVTQVRKVEATI